MVKVDLDNCRGCGICVKVCPLNAIIILEKKAIISENCVQCGICTKVCKFDAVHKAESSNKFVACTSCPVQCQVGEGFQGACQRYKNVGGKLIRSRELVIKNENMLNEVYRRNMAPIITAVGAGTAYPCSRPAPYIVEDVVDGVDVVTVVTEAPLSYSGVKVKVDTNAYLGEEGAKIKRNGHIVGMIEMEEYGSKMLAIGGANLLTGTEGYTVADTVVKLANGEAVEVVLENKTKIMLQVGKAPIVNGVEEEKMRVGCGSATVGLFARDFKDAVDEVIVLDHHVVGLFTEHLAGEEVGKTWSGVVPNARKSTRGRYFGEHGDGWGGTNIVEPINAIKSIDMKIAKVGMKILVTETTGLKYALFNLEEDGTVKETKMTEKAKQVVEKIQRTCEPSRVSVIYSGGTGGSARAGVTNEPLELTKAVHEGKVNLTIGGAQAFVWPGGGINFLVDTENVVQKAFTWVPTPATVAPVEYTMKKSDYEAIGGHMDKIRKLSDIKEEMTNQ